MSEILTIEEIELMYKDNPGFEQHIKKCLDLGVDPIKGMAFVKEFIGVINKTKLDLERKYHMQTDIVCSVNILAKHKEDRDEVQVPAVQGDSTT